MQGGCTHFPIRSTRLSAHGTSLYSRSTRPPIRLFTRNTRLSTRSIRLSTRSTCSTTCRSFYD